MKLKIPFQTQQHNAARNDCGAACVAMVAGVTTDKVLQAISQPKHQPLLFDDMRRALSAYRIRSEHKRPLHLPDLRQILTSGRPVIALVGYDQLPAEHKAQPDFDGAHFVLVTGFTEDSFFVHDPLWPDERGAYRQWPMETMGLALLQPGWRNMPLQGLVVDQVREIAEPGMGELGTAVAAVMHETVARHYLEKLLGAMGIENAGSLEERVGHALAAWQLVKGNQPPPLD
ncbi:MAG: C39 family peptidase [Chloroflexota bacterium]